MLISLASFLAGGLIVGALALFNLSVSSDLPLADNRILIPPVLVGGIVGVIISVFVLRNRKIFVGKLEVERRATEKLKFILDQNRELFRNLFADAGVGQFAVVDVFGIGEHVLGGEEFFPRDFYPKGLLQTEDDIEKVDALGIEVVH